MAQKGSNFEREICKQLSLWWSGNKEDDIFWRTAGSGAMAKTRSKKGKSTFGQCGDVQATNPKGQPLIDMFSIELKRGYTASTFADLMEPSTTANAKPCQYEKFIHQACVDHINSGSMSWLLIVKRDRKKAIVIMPFVTYKQMPFLSTSKKLAPSFKLRCELQTGNMTLFGCTLESFLNIVRPADIIQEISNYKKTTLRHPQKKKSKKRLDLEAQVYKCPNCEAHAVTINESNEYSCSECRSSFRDLPG